MNAGFKLLWLGGFTRDLYLLWKCVIFSTGKALLNGKIIAGG